MASSGEIKEEAAALSLPGDIHRKRPPAARPACDETESSVNIGHLHDLTKWIFEEKSDGNTVLGESRNLKVLNSVVAAPHALVRLKKGSTLEEAVLFSDHPGKVFLNSLSIAMKRLEDAKSISHHANDYLPEASEKIDAIKEITRELSYIVRGKMDSKDSY